MLKPAVIGEIQDGTITKENGFLCVVTRYYPRFLARNRIDEYVALLSPTKKLLADFKNASRRIGHDAAFLKIDYQNQFALTSDALNELERLTLISKASDVFLSCYCAREHFCHRDLLLIYAEKFYGAEIEKPHHDYAVFRERIEKMPPGQVAFQTAITL